MKLLDLLRLIRKHLVLLILTPLLLAGLVAYMTRKPTYSYSSETTLYTGIASGGGVEMDKSLSFFATNTAFDNLINVIKSRQTQEEVGIRLLAQHLLLNNPDPKYLSRPSFNRLKQIVPHEIIKLVVKKADPKPRKEIQPRPVSVPVKEAEESKVKLSFHRVKPGETLYGIAKQYGQTPEELKEINEISENYLEVGQVLRIRPFSGKDSTDNPSDTINGQDSLRPATTFSFTQFDSTETREWLPPNVSREAYEQTVENLISYASHDDTNFVYKLLNYSNPHYSVKAISAVNVQRIASSDLVKLKYENDDPGICQQTLSILTDVCIKNFKDIKENRSDAVVRYFEFQVKQASAKLKVAEDKLLKFNKDNNIINYYEQSKAVAVVKEDLDVTYHNMRIKLAGTMAAITRIEEKLSNQKKIQLNSSEILDLRNRLSEINLKIADLEILGKNDSATLPKLNKLKSESTILKARISNSISKLYTYGHTTDGLPINNLLQDWLTNVLDYENTKAGMAVLGDRIKDFQKQYAVYAPAGANLKRIEREINVSEQAYLELLHGLNLAKLKMQDIELSSNIKAIDPPFFPLSPNPTKRSLLVVVAGLFGFLLVLVTILATEYLDKTLKNPEKATRILGIKPAGIFPKIYLKVGSLNFPFVVNRLSEMFIQQLEWHGKNNAAVKPLKVLFFSTLSTEGKTTIIGNVALKLKLQGKRVLVLNFSRESLRTQEVSQPGYGENPVAPSTSGDVNMESRGIFFKRLLGYPDTRIDFNSPFLQSPEEFLEPEEYIIYPFDNVYLTARTFKDILSNVQHKVTPDPDFIFLEMPPLVYYPYSAELLYDQDVAIMTCRANRVWTSADQSALDTTTQVLKYPPSFILNGVEIPVIETYLGELPKKRNKLRRILKKLISFQFYNQYKP